MKRMMTNGGERRLLAGEVAKTLGVGVQTLHFYEQQGLIPPPPRSESGYRLYSQQTVRRLRFIKRAQELGFSLKEVEELLVLQLDPSSTCSNVRERAAAKIADIDQKLKTLSAIKEALAQIVTVCPSNGRPVSDCPILENLDSEG